MTNPVLPDTGDDIDARDGYGQTAPMRAAHAGQLAALASAGADRGSGAPGFASKTAADLACDRSDTTLASILDPTT